MLTTTTFTLKRSVSANACRMSDDTRHAADLQWSNAEVVKMYDDRREAVLRQRRASRETEAIVDNPLMSPEARNLLNHLLSKPQTFQINQRYVIRRGDYGGRDKVRRLFREMILAGHC